MGQPSSPSQPKSRSPSPSPNLPLQNPPIPSQALEPFGWNPETRSPRARGINPLEEEQRMSSSSDLEQQMAAALRRQTPVAAAPAGAGRGALDRAAAAAAAAAIQRRKAAQRARAEGAYFAQLASTRSLADQNFSRREPLKGLKDELRNLQSQLTEALTLQLRKESKCKLTEWISEATTTNERLRSSVADFRSKRDIHAATVSEELQALESLEAESNEDAEMAEVSRALLWYEKFLGFRVIVGEGGVEFVFDKIDPQCPEKEYSFRISPRLQFIDCDPHVKDIEELAKDLDLSEHLYQFVRMAREKFQSSSMNGTLPVGPVVSSRTLPVGLVVSSGTLPLSPVVCPDVSAAAFPSPMVMSVNNRSEDAHYQTQSLSKNNVQLLPAKREATGASPGVLRRSPRLEGMRGASS